MKTFADYGIHVEGSGEVSTTCPDCSGDRKKHSAKCLSVNIDKGVWFCHHCGFCGGLKDGKENNNGNYRPNPKSKPFTRPNYSYQPLSAKARKYLLEDRGLDSIVLDANRVGSVNGSIAFPFYKSGEVINIKYRDANKRFRLEAGAELIPYGYDDISEITIITEGEIDKLSLESAGCKNSISVPNGAPSSTANNFPKHFAYLENCETRFDEVKKFIIAVDNDGPGKVLEAELSRRLGLGRCCKAVWPDGCKDPNDVLLKFGNETLKKCIESAKPFPVDGIVYVSELDMQGYYERGDVPGISLGWEKLKKHFTLCRESGQLNIVTGVPGHGKSEFVDAIMINTTMQEGWRWGVFSPENFPFNYHARKLSEKFIGKPFADSGFGRMGLEDVDLAQEWLNDHIYFMAPKEDDTSVDSILSLAKTLVYRHGINGLVIDPWNELDHERPANLSETEYISKCLTKIRRFSRVHNCHVFLVAHPTKLQKQEKGENKGEYVVPRPYDIAGSAGWFNKADNCLTVWRASKRGSHDAVIHVQKIKKKYLGQIGSVTLKYDYHTGRYNES